MDGNVGEILCSRCVWIYFGTGCWMAGTENLETCFSVKREKEEKSGMCVGGGWLWLSGAENWLLMVATLSVK